MTSSDKSSLSCCEIHLDVEYNMASDLLEPISAGALPSRACCGVKPSLVFHAIFTLAISLLTAFLQKFADVVF
jgi:hypothetical protein